MKPTSPVWAEFSSGAGWEVSLNATGFNHVNLLLDYARAYHRAARRSLDSVNRALQDENCSQTPSDMDAHPIVFLYRHALEVYLKTVIVFGNHLRGLRGEFEVPWKDIFTRHKLVDLLPSVQEVLEQAHCSGIWVAPSFQTFSDVRQMVETIDEVPHAALRYPVGMKGNQVGQLLPDGVHFNVHTFAAKLDALLYLLDQAAQGTWQTFQQEGLSHPMIRDQIRAYFQS